MLFEIQLTTLLLLYSLSALLTLGLTAYGVRELRAGWDVTTAAFVAIVLSCSIWTVSRFFELLFVSEILSRFWLTMIYIGYGGATMAILCFGLAFTGRKDLLTKRTVGLLLVLPTIAIGVAATNGPVHQLFWVGDFNVRSGWWGEILVYEREFRTLFKLYLVYTVGGAIIGLYYLMRMAVGSPDVYRRQTISFGLGSAIALGFGVMFGLEMQPVPDFVDLTPVGMAIMSLFFAYGIFRYKMLDLVPVARDTVIESMRDGYIVLDGEDRVVDLNDAATEILDTDDTIVGVDIDETLPEASSILREHEQGTRIERELDVEVGGDQRFLVANVSSLYEGETLIGRLVLLRDVTDRRSVQKRYQALIENSSDLILVVEPDGEITYASPSLRNITGVPPDEILGANALDFVHEADREEFTDLIHAVLDEPGEKRRTEYRTFDDEGNQLYMEASIWNLLDNPFVEGIVVNAREITERKKREQEIREKNDQLTRANEQLEQFAGVISHDLRNPINVAKGHVELAREGNEGSFDTIEEALERMEAIIDDVLTLARQGESIGETRVVTLEETARHAWDHVATDEATLEVRTDGSFEADPDRLLQLFENLFRNAHEHGGDDVTVGVGLENGAMYVEDDGPGIPEDERDSVLEAGHTTNQDGTGLGLSIVTQIAGAHGWEVQVADGTDGGARFEFAGIERAE